MKKIKLIVILLCFSFIAQSQVDSIAVKDSINTFLKDSADTYVLEGYNAKMAKIEKQRINDSIKKTDLEAQINALKTTDNLKKDELQKQLQDLNNKESQRIANKKAQIEEMRNSAKGYPVIGFFKDTLFNIYSKLGSFSVKDRALAISKKIEALENFYDFHPDSLKLVEDDGTIDIICGESIIMSVIENDALWNNSTKLETAKLYQGLIIASVINYNSETSVLSIFKKIGLAILVLVIALTLLFYVNKFFNWFSLKIEAQEGKLINGIKIKNYTLFDAQRQVGFFQFVTKLIKWFSILIIIYIALPILFGIFPSTQGFASTLFGYILNPAKKIGLGLWNYLPNLITILVIIFIFRYVFRGINFLKTEVEKGNLVLNGFYKDWANPTYQIIKVVIFAFMVIVIFPYLPGSDSPIFQGVSVFLGFLFTFGSAGSLSNIVAGLVLTYMRLFKIGDRVKIGDVFGDVIEKSMLVTRVRTTKNEIISIPNSTVMSSHTINYSSDAPEKGLIIHTTVTLGYDVPWRKVNQALIDAALRTELILKEPTPFVLQTSLDDFYVSYQINAYVREANKQAKIYSDLHQNIQDLCNEQGIEILSPHYRAARDGNMTTIPENYLDKDYKAPSFNVNIKGKDNLSQ